ncbi:MAG: YdeI/OmpD-associated family protein [Psychroserpens sp.]|nr:YdeI/OmpD-associated family protein [Psychroserpens sp.]
MVKSDNLTTIQITTQKELRSWLLENHSQVETVWLITFKKSVPDQYVSRWEVLDELLCFGWIDGIRRKLDHQRTMQLISPRKAEHWAKSYKDRADILIREGKMHSSGLNAIKTSKTKGLWNFMDDVDQLIIPEDLVIELNKLSGAYEFFDGINPSSKRFVLRWLKLAKTDKTRKQRIDKIATLSSKGQKLPGS